MRPSWFDTTIVYVHLQRKRQSNQRQRRDSIYQSYSDGNYQTVVVISDSSRHDKQTDIRKWVIYDISRYLFAYLFRLQKATVCEFWVHRHATAIFAERLMVSAIHGMGEETYRYNPLPIHWVIITSFRDPPSPLLTITRSTSMNQKGRPRDQIRKRDSFNRKTTWWTIFLPSSSLLGKDWKRTP